MSDRKYYIDNLRWTWILLLVPFHAAMAWNGWEGNYIWFYENKILSAFVIFIVPWFMPLLFVLAGISARYSLEKRGGKNFLLERIKKLLVPLLTGILTVVPFMAYRADQYHNQYQGGFFSHYKVFFTTYIDLTGYSGDFTPGHLWFLLYLFLISLIGFVVIKLQRKLLNKLSFSSCPTIYIVFLVIFPMIMTPVLNFGGKSLGMDLALFLIGYYVLSEEKVLKKITNYHFAYLVLMLICDIAMTKLFVFDTQRTGIVISACNLGAMWFGILGFIGVARLHFNQNTLVTRYMTSRSFLVYIFHFGWLVEVQYLISKSSLHIIEAYIVSVLLSLVLTLITCEVARRIPGVRVLFGIKQKRRS